MLYIFLLIENSFLILDKLIILIFDYKNSINNYINSFEFY